MVETLEKGGMEKQWCLRICQNLRDAERSLKTDYRVHCQQSHSTCCRKFALSDPVNPELQHPCPHQHQSTCEQCQGLKNVLKEVRLAIKESSWKPYSSEKREDFLYDFDRADSDIMLWKAHIVCSINQEEAKQDALKSKDRGAPNETIVQNHLNIALLNVF